MEECGPFLTKYLCLCFFSMTLLWHRPQVDSSFREDKRATSSAPSNLIEPKENQFGVNVLKRGPFLKLLFQEKKKKKKKDKTNVKTATCYYRTIHRILQHAATYTQGPFRHCSHEELHQTYRIYWVEWPMCSNKQQLNSWLWLWCTFSWPRTLQHSWTVTNKTKTLLQYFNMPPSCF